MIGQNIGLEYVVPLAFEHLQRDPLAAGDFSPGDLLGSVLKVSSSFWRQQPDVRQAVEALWLEYPISQPSCTKNSRFL
jgi:hypothetical protein